MNDEESTIQVKSGAESEKPAPKEPMKNKTPSKLEVFARKAGLWLLFLLAGVLIATLAFYLPARSKLNQAQVEIERLQEIEQQYNELVPRFEIAQAQANVYKTISDTILLRTALQESNSAWVSQQLRYVEDDLNSLSVQSYPEIINRLQSQFGVLKASVTANPDQALDELELFYNDLLLLAVELK